MSWFIGVFSHRWRPRQHTYYMHHWPGQDKRLDLNWSAPLSCLDCFHWNFLCWSAICLKSYEVAQDRYDLSTMITTKFVFLLEKFMGQITVAWFQVCRAKSTICSCRSSSLSSKPSSSSSPPSPSPSPSPPPPSPPLSPLYKVCDFCFVLFSF